MAPEEQRRKSSDEKSFGVFEKLQQSNANSEEPFNDFDSVKHPSEEVVKQNIENLDLASPKNS